MPPAVGRGKELTFVFKSLLKNGKKWVRIKNKIYSFHVLVFLYHATHAYAHHVTETCKGPRGPLGGIREIRQKWVFVRYESRNGNYANQYSSEQDRLFVP